MHHCADMMHRVVAAVMRHGPNHLCVQHRHRVLRRRHLRRGPCQGKIMIGPLCGFRHDPATTNVSVVRQFSGKASVARPAISPKPSRHLVFASRLSTITMAARRERLQLG
jgi:hypothetical protein